MRAVPAYRPRISLQNINDLHVCSSLWRGVRATSRTSGGWPRPLRSAGVRDPSARVQDPIGSLNGGGRLPVRTRWSPAPLWDVKVVVCCLTVT